LTIAPALAKFVFKRILLIALIVPLINPLECQAKQKEPASKSFETSDLAAKSGKVPANFETGACGNYVVRFEQGPLRFSMPPSLIAVDKHNLSNLTYSQVSALLYGPVGSAVDFEVLMPDGKVKTINLIREAVKSAPVWERHGIGYENFDRRSGGNWNGAFVEDSLDIIARATQNLVLRQAREWPVDDPLPVSTASVCAALINYDVGNIATGDEYLRLAESSYKPGSRFRLGQNRQVTKSITTLISVGRINYAERLLKMLSEAGSMQPFGDYDAFKILAQAQLKTDKSAALVTVEKYKTSGTRSALRNVPNEKWMAQIYLNAGESDKAKEIYVELISKAIPSDDNWANLEEFAANSLQYASLQYAQADGTGAIASLEKAENRLKTNLSSEQLDTIQKMPGVFPKLSDIESAVDAVKGGKQFPSKLFARDVPEDYAFPDIRACHDAIEKGDKDTATRLINSFLERYKGRVPEALLSSGQQNLYSSILTLAREIADKGWIALSNEVLLRLQSEAEGKDANSLAHAFLKAELVYNETQNVRAAAQGRDLTPIWKEFSRVYHETARPAGYSESDDDASKIATVIPWRDYSFSERLRVMALTFYYADELERAELFINRALKEHDLESGAVNPNALRAYDEPLAEKAMMLLDAACIAAKKGQVDKANAYWAEILKLPAVNRDGYGHTIVELASIYSNNGKRDQAIAILQAARAKPVELKVYQIDNGVTVLDLFLAKLLLQSGKSKEAHAIADTVAAKMPKRLHWSQCLIIAQCAEAAGDYAQAAKYYAEGQWSSRPFEFQTEGDAPYLQKALVLADKAKDFDKLEFAKILTEVAQHKDQQHQDEVFALLKRACELYPDANPQKSILMTRLARMQPSGTAGSIKVGEINKGEPRQPENKTKSKQEQLKLLRDAATLAEKNGHPNARELWSQIASSEVCDGNVEQGLADEHHVMQIYDTKCAANHDGILGARSFIIRCLTNQGHNDDAERLLIEAIVKTKAVAGPRSVAAQAQEADLFAFYVEQKKFALAQAPLDQVLKGNLASGESLSQSLMHSHCGPGWPQAADATEVMGVLFTSLDDAERTNPEFVRAAFEKILKAQRDMLTINNERFVPTLARLGDINFKLQKFSDADVYYAEAFEIASSYHKGEFAVRQVGKNYIANLRKLGRNKEADKLSDAQYEGVR
jgi:hypothetical protein